MLGTNLSHALRSIELDVMYGANVGDYASGGILIASL